jgi:hypothetical protein
VTNAAVFNPAQRFFRSAQAAPSADVAQVPPYFNTGADPGPSGFPTAPGSTIAAALMKASMQGPQPGPNYLGMVPSAEQFKKLLGNGTPLGDWIRQQASDLLPHGFGQANDQTVPGSGIFGTDLFGSGLSADRHARGVAVGRRPDPGRP